MLLLNFTYNEDVGVGAGAGHVAGLYLDAIVGGGDGLVAVLEEWHVDGETARVRSTLGEPLARHEQVALARLHVGGLDLLEEPVLARAVRVMRDAHLAQAADVVQLDHERVAARAVEAALELLDGHLVAGALGAEELERDVRVRARLGQVARVDGHIVRNNFLL